MDGNTVESVDHFVYLGSLQSSGGQCRPDLTLRIGLACAVTTSLKRILHDKRLTLNTKLCIYQTLVLSVLTMHLTTTHQQTWLFSSTKTYHSTDLLTTQRTHVWRHDVDCGHGGGATMWQMPDAVLNCPMDYATILTSIHDGQYIDRVGVMARERSGSSVDQNSVTIQRTTDTDGRDTVLHTCRSDWDADRE